jgi:hypothetical protein
MEKKLGKIIDVNFGLGGYKGVMIGLHVTLGSKEWIVSDSRCYWDVESVKLEENSEWTEDDRDKQYAEILRYLSKLMKQAKVDSVDKLKGIPVEVIIEGNTLKEWRVLTEVL